MTQYDNTNSGALFAAKERKTDNHPTHTGSINVNGVDFWLSAWVKEKGDMKYFSLSVKEKDQQTNQQSNQHQNQDGMGGNYGNEAARGGNGDLDDEIPF